MRNFKIIFKLATPVACSGLIHLDALISAAMAKEILGEDYYLGNPAQSDLIEAELPLDKKYGVWCASVGFGDNRESIGNWSKRWDDKNDDVVKFNSKVKERIDIGSGYFKNYRMPLIIKSYREMVFYARGDKEEIKRLLDTYIHGIGKKISQGHGIIREKVYEDMVEDYSLFRGDTPSRPIPVNQCPAELKEKMKSSGSTRMVIERHPLKPPYWRTDCYEKCYMPVV